MGITPTDELAERPHERLRRMLDRAGLSNREVADRIEVAAETVSRWRSGQQEMRGRDLRSIIALLAERGIVVTEEWIRSGEVASSATSTADLSAVVAATSKPVRGAQLERKDEPAPRGSGAVKKVREKGRESA